MKFNTQVCTTREQSERLLALGLKKETADMYLTRCFVGNNGTPMVFVGTTHKPSTVLFSKEDIPAWSLHRIITMCPNCILDRHPCLHKTILDKSIHYFDENWKEESESSFSAQLNLFDNFIDCIEWLIKENHFNKQYLNESL